MGIEQPLREFTDPGFTKLARDVAPLPSKSEYLDSESRATVDQVDSESRATMDQVDSADRHKAGRSAIVWVKNWAWTILVRPYQIFCLLVLIGVTSMIPILQLAPFGYMLDVAGTIARTRRFSVPKLDLATRLVTAGIGLYLCSLPTKLFATWIASAELIRLDNPSTIWLRFGGQACSLLAMLYLLWAWGRGGRLRDYFWPAPIRFLREGWRLRFWSAAYDRFWRMLQELEVVRLFWLGLRGFVGTTAWIAIPAVILIGAARNGETGAAGVVGALGVIGMGIVLMYLPYLQVAMAADNRLWSIFGVRRVRRCFRRSPLAFWFGLLATFGLAIPPYLLKIEAVPREYAWIMASIVGSFVLPARFLTGWAMGRASRLEEPRGCLLFVYRWLVRFLIPPLIGAYLIVLIVTQFTSWYGLAGTWFLQHAISVPTPFNGT